MCPTFHTQSVEDYVTLAPIKDCFRWSCILLWHTAVAYWHMHHPMSMVKSHVLDYETLQKLTRMDSAINPPECPCPSSFKRYHDHQHNIVAMMMESTSKRTKETILKYICSVTSHYILMVFSSMHSEIRI